MDSSFHDSGHDELMQAFSFIPSVDPPSSPSAFFNIHDHITSDNDCDLPDNEDAVDIIKYLDCPEVVKSDFLTSTRTLTQVYYEEPTLDRASISLSQLAPIDWAAEIANDWAPNVKLETQEPVFNGWIAKREIEEDEFTTGLDFDLYSPSKFDLYSPSKFDLYSPSKFDLYSPSKFSNMSDPEIEINIATGNNSDVDVESVETATDDSCSTDMFDATVPSTSTASTSRSTKAKNKVVYTAHVISTPRPVGRPRGRPRGSKKKQQSARTGHATTGHATTGHASTSNSASLPSCSKPEAENSTASNPVVLGRKRKQFKDDKTQSQPTYTQVSNTSITANFHDYALNPTASPPTTETARPTVVARRTYRRNTVDAVDKDKQNHHNELERNRRQKLADLFTDLRDEVPKISCNPKASKVLILNEARFHILDLENTNKLQEEEASRLSQNQKLLKILLQQLQSKISGRVK